MYLVFRRRMYTGVFGLRHVKSRLSLRECNCEDGTEKHDCRTNCKHSILQRRLQNCWRFAAHQVFGKDVPCYRMPPIACINLISWKTRCPSTGWYRRVSLMRPFNLSLASLAFRTVILSRLACKSPPPDGISQAWRDTLVQTMCELLCRFFPFSWSSKTMSRWQSSCITSSFFCQQFIRNNLVTQIY